MANLQALRKRLKSIKTTGEISAAMKTVATANFARVSAQMKGTDGYSSACDEMLSLLGGAGIHRECDTVEKRNCFVVLSHNRGFCGGFNDALLSLLEAEYGAEETPPLMLAAGKKACEYLTRNNIPYEELEWKAVPEAEDARDLVSRIENIYVTGKAEKVFIIYQKYINMLVQKPEKKQILPSATSDGILKSEDILMLPDRETVTDTLARPMLTDNVYRIMLGHAAGAQAATAVAMRSACDNAKESAEKLELAINRIRQSQVTNSVIETSAALAEQNTEAL